MTQTIIRQGAVIEVPDQWRFYTKVEDAGFSPTAYETHVYRNDELVKRQFHAFQFSARRIAKRIRWRIERAERKDRGMGVTVREGVL